MSQVASTAAGATRPALRGVRELQKLLSSWLGGRQRLWAGRGCRVGGPSQRQTWTGWDRHTRAVQIRSPGPGLMAQGKHSASLPTALGPQAPPHDEEEGASSAQQALTRKRLRTPWPFTCHLCLWHSQGVVRNADLPAKFRNVRAPLPVVLQSCLL